MERHDKCLARFYQHHIFSHAGCFFGGESAIQSEMRFCHEVLMILPTYLFGRYPRLLFFTSKDFLLFSLEVVLVSILGVSPIQGYVVKIFFGVRGLYL